MTEHCVIVGAGQAGAQTAQSLRQGGFSGPITMLGEEPQPPYQRPPLSKKYLAGELDAERLWLRPPEFYGTNSIALRTGVTVTGIDPAARTLSCGDTQILDYDHLVLTTGTHSRSLPLPGIDRPAVLPLRTMADVDALRPSMRGGKLVIIGAGYIGLEVAAVARTLGLEVCVLETQDRVLKRVVTPVLSTFFESLHKSHGVELRFGVSIDAIEGEDGTPNLPGAARAVRLTSGERIGCDLVLVAVGAAPNDQLARAAGLAVDDGILVDEACRTSDPHILAAGDCTRFFSARFGARIRLESVQNAIDQAKAAAATICGNPGIYDPVPWFWSDQYDVKLQIAGLSSGHDEARIVGDPAGGSFYVAYLRDGALLAVDSINHPRSHMMARRALGQPWREDLLPAA
ncbi:FAD-dependent oxidoreductase [Breoghania sp. L-A4]|uniref:NAD(P)/FAD-dependent oxidoreductase n=1 Tax=Breoghania sp. L-A4 TaxID=2304600 RepID=UPI000E360260|nr:FAD-dependent oxidoreductase [Breoghania sp. L-A4]AXS42033.1 pyridine nucleotide-disulfide oxidoreductase [Breoghania sp. L-A4]